MIVPLWRAAVPFLLLCGLGLALDRVLRLDAGGEPGPGRPARWALLGLSASFALALHPALLAAIVVPSLAARAVRRARPKPGGAPRPADETSASGPFRRMRAGARARWIYVALAVALVIAIARPATPLYWDEFVWLAKARLESEAGWGALRRAALDASAGVAPSGYPLLWPLCASWLSAYGRSAEALAAGAAAGTMLCVWLFLDAADRLFASRGRPRWALGTAVALLALAPLVFVHLRSAYVDLPVGLLAAALTFGMAERLDERDGPPHRPTTNACLAFVLAGLKDEGFAYVVVIVGAALGAIVIAERRRGARLPNARTGALVALAAATLPFLTWRALLAIHHVDDGDHRLGLPVLAALLPVLEQAGGAVTDWRSWGLLWPAVLGAVVAAAIRVRQVGPSTLFATLALLARGFVLVAAIVCGPERVRVFAFEGTLLNRLLIQLAPAAIGVLMLVVADAVDWRIESASAEPPATPPREGVPRFSGAGSLR